MTNANPSLDPANNDSLVGAFRQVLTKYSQSLNCALPASVISFDRTANLVQVQPQIMVLTTDGAQITRAQIASIPVYQIGGGGFVLNFNLNPGDLGWIIACDRDISLFMQSFSSSQPNTTRTHDFADSFFLPNILNGFAIDSLDSENAVLQSLDGTVKISLGASKITIAAPTVEIDSAVTITGDLLVEGDLTVDGDSLVDGHSVVLDYIASGADITAVGAITPFTPIPP